MREWEEVQEVLRRLKRVVPASASHTHARRFRTDHSTPSKRNPRNWPVEMGSIAVGYKRSNLFSFTACEARSRFRIAQHNRPFWPLWSGPA